MKCPHCDKEVEVWQSDRGVRCEYTERNYELRKPDKPKPRPWAVGDLAVYKFPKQFKEKAEQLGSMPRRVVSVYNDGLRVDGMPENEYMKVTFMVRVLSNGEIDPDQPNA